MARLTTSQRVIEMYREEKMREILMAFDTITREEVLAMVESFIEKGVITVRETKTKVVITLHRSCTSWGFVDIIEELERTCEYRTSRTDKEWRKVTTFKITDALVQIIAF